MFPFFGYFRNSFQGLEESDVFIIFHQFRSIFQGSENNPAYAAQFPIGLIGGGYFIIFQIPFLKLRKPLWL